jgi:hypothetical protein
VALLAGHDDFMAGLYQVLAQAGRRALSARDLGWSDDLQDAHEVLPDGRDKTPGSE